MKLIIDLPDEITKRIDAAAKQNCRVSATDFVHDAILNELERVRNGGHIATELADLAAQIQELRSGQRAIIALVDSSATIFSALLRGNSGETNDRHSRTRCDRTKRVI